MLGHFWQHRSPHVNAPLRRGLGIQPHDRVQIHGQEREAGNSKALTFRNFASVVHSLQNIITRRVAKLLYGQC